MLKLKSPRLAASGGCLNNDMSDVQVHIAGTAQKCVSPDPWEHLRPIITSLYFDQKNTLPEVMRTLARVHNHYGSAKIYKGRIKKWGLDKKHKESEMRAIVSLKRPRDATGKRSAFSIRGRQVTAADVLRYFKRKGILNPDAEVESVDAIPETVRCWTPPPEDEPELAEMGNDLKVSKGSEPSQPVDSGTLVVTSTTSSEGRLPQTSTIHQMRRLLPLGPEMETMELHRSPLPPQTLLLPERLLFHIKAYYEGSLRSGIFTSDEQGYLMHDSENGRPRHHLNNFIYLCHSGSALFKDGVFLEGRRLLSMASNGLKEIIQEQHPRALDTFLTVVLKMSTGNCPELAAHLLNYIGKMTAQLLHINHPWTQILLMAGKAQDSDLQPMLAEVLFCTTNTFQNLLGTFHKDALFSKIDYISNQIDLEKANRLLLGLLEAAELQMDEFDGRVLRIRISYGACLYRQCQFAKAISVLQKIPITSKSYYRALIIRAYCNFAMDHRHEAEMNIREGMKRDGRHCGGADLTILEQMNILRSWLYEWGRVTESEALALEIRERTERVGIDDI